MFLTIIFCSLLDITNWLQNHLITCPFKALTGIDCPGCGFQRSVIALLQGDWSKSLHLYPATIPLLITVSAFGVDKRVCFDKDDTIKKAICIFTGTIIMGSYIIKMYGMHY